MGAQYLGIDFPLLVLRDLAGFYLFEEELFCTMHFLAIVVCIHCPSIFMFRKVVCCEVDWIVVQKGWL